MSELIVQPNEALDTHLSGAGYVFVAAEAMRQALVATGPLTDWGDFAAS